MVLVQSNQWHSQHASPTGHTSDELTTLDNTQDNVIHINQDVHLKSLSYMCLLGCILSSFEVDSGRDV